MGKPAPFEALEMSKHLGKRGAHVLTAMPSDAASSADPRKTKLAGCSVGASMGRTTMTKAPAPARNAPENTENTRMPSVEEDAATPATKRQTAHSIAAAQSCGPGMHASLDNDDI